MSSDMELAERITDARLGCGMTVAEASRKLGIKPKTLIDWESGKRSPRANKLQMIAGVFNVSLVWLLNGRDDLDPLPADQDNFKSLESKLKQIETLQNEVNGLIDSVGQEVRGLRQRSATLDKLAIEELQVRAG